MSDAEEMQLAVAWLLQEELVELPEPMAPVAEPSVQSPQRWGAAVPSAFVPVQVERISGVPPDSVREMALSIVLLGGVLEEPTLVVDRRRYLGRGGRGDEEGGQAASR